MATKQKPRSATTASSWYSNRRDRRRRLVRARSSFCLGTCVQRKLPSTVELSAHAASPDRMPMRRGPHRKRALSGELVDHRAYVLVASLACRMGEVPSIGGSVGELGRNDGLISPHCDGLNWPQFVRSAAEDPALIERGSEAARKWVPEWSCLSSQTGQGSGRALDPGDGGEARCASSSGRAGAGVGHPAGEAPGGVAAGAEVGRVSRPAVLCRRDKCRQTRVIRELGL